MFCTRAALAAILLAFAFAQQDGPTSSDNGTFIEDEITIHTVTVGLVGHQFYPSAVMVSGLNQLVSKYPANQIVQANVGDKVWTKPPSL